MTFDEIIELVKQSRDANFKGEICVHFSGVMKPDSPQFAQWKLGDNVTSEEAEKLFRKRLKVT